MAKATAIQNTNMKFNRTVVLELTPVEAVILQAILGNITGPTYTSIRKYTSKIFIALDDVEVPSLVMEPLFDATRIEMSKILNLAEDTNG